MSYNQRYSCRWNSVSHAHDARSIERRAGTRAEREKRRKMVSLGLRLTKIPKVRPFVGRSPQQACIYADSNSRLVFRVACILRLAPALKFHPCPCAPILFAPRPSFSADSPRPSSIQLRVSLLCTPSPIPPPSPRLSPSLWPVSVCPFPILSLFIGNQHVRPSFFDSRTHPLVSIVLSRSFAASLPLEHTSNQGIGS